MGASPRLSVVIPCLDEEQLVEAAIRSAGGADEIIVVDGGSRDRTCERATAAGALVLSSPRGRGLQLDCGARRASGDWIVFLHADTRLEPGWPAALRGLGPATVGGAFRLVVDSPRWAYRCLELGVSARCRLFRLPYGDQALFVRREAYASTGGFPPFPLMEDVALVRRLHRLGRLELLALRAFTSPRRWERHGLVATSLRNWWILALYAAGCPPERLERLYAGRGVREGS